MALGGAVVGAGLGEDEGFGFRVGPGSGDLVRFGVGCGALVGSGRLLSCSASTLAGGGKSSTFAPSRVPRTVSVQVRVGYSAPK